MRRFRQQSRDDIQRQMIKLKMEAGVESVEWMNSFMQKFWLIFEPVLSALVVENLDNYLADYLPPYLDSIRLSTFTLGTKPFRIESVKTFPSTSPDLVCMDWKVSFIPNDLDDLSIEDLENKVNPKVVMNVRVGRGRVGAGFPVLVENMTFTGHLRVKIKFMGKFPFAKLVNLSFLEKPHFDYGLKPLGTDSFGFDVNIIPGLQGFIKEQVHAILGPLMYAPNVFTLDLEKLLNGDFDFSSANGVLAITVHSTSQLENIQNLVDDKVPSTYIRFYIDHGQELDRTSICERSFAPAWNETKFLMLNNLHSLLSIELRSARAGLKDRRLGTANFDLSKLEGGINPDQEEVSLPILRNGKYTGDVRLGIKYLPISKPVKQSDGTLKLAEESNSGVVRFAIYEGRNMKERANTHVRIFINGTEKNKTQTIKRNANPKYQSNFEMVILDKTSVYVRVELREDESVLGAFNCQLMDLIQSEDEWYNFALDNQNPGQVRINVEWKPMLMTGYSDAVSSRGFDKTAIGVIRFTFWEAQDLRNVENVTGGKSDPYVRVLSGHHIRGRTEVIDNNLNPEWGETLYVPVHSLKENFVLEAMDWNARTRDKTLGFTEFAVSSVIKQCIGSQSTDPDVWYESNGQLCDRWDRLYSADRQSFKGKLHYSAEFLPAIQYSDKDSLPSQSLVGTHIRYTPDNLIDLNSYTSGVLNIRIHEVQLSAVNYCYCQVIVDALMPQYKTTKLRGDSLPFDEFADAFIKEIDFSRIAIEIKPASADEKEIYKLGHWIDTGASIVRRIVNQKRSGLDNQGHWFNLSGTDGPGRIKLSFEYTPLDSFILNPDESLDNQGVLSVELMSAHNIMAADKTGTSDPYVIFTVNGERAFKSDVIKKTLNPEWSHAKFSVPIQSRVTASIRIEVFDWNHVKGHQPIGSGGITVRGDAVESFASRIVKIPLDGVSGVSGYVQIRFNWHPQLLVSKKTQTSVLGSTRTYAHSDANNMEVSGPLLQSPVLSSRGTSLDIESSRFSLDDNSSLAPSTWNENASLDTSNATGQDGFLEIILLEARGLRGVDKSGTSDPFVRVRKDRGSEIYKTRYISKTLSPEWNESFKCRVVGMEPFVLDFKVKDHNKIRSAVDLGQCRYNLWDLVSPDQGKVNNTQWLPLSPVGSGELLITVKYSQ
ncbi:C2 domain-containing protein [Sporodiniella umbellata]|nr:C2 domain-containing protein [Sporodiniella umbellata]